MRSITKRNLIQLELDGKAAKHVGKYRTPKDELLSALKDITEQLRKSADKNVAPISVNVETPTPEPALVKWTFKIKHKNGNLDEITAENEILAKSKNVGMMR